MIPIVFFLGLNLYEMLLFQTLQTILDFGLIILFLYLILKKIDQNNYSIKKILFIGLTIEGMHVVSFFMWYVFVLYAAGGIVMIIVFLFFAPYIAIYLIFSYNSNEKSGNVEDSQMPLKNIIINYFVSVPPALILSCIIVSVFFNLFGITNVFIFS